MGDWQECIGECGNGVLGVRKRSVVCVVRVANYLDDETEIMGVSDAECKHKPRPKSVEKCEIDFKRCMNLNGTGYWITSDWTNVHK